MKNTLFLLLFFFVACNKGSNISSISLKIEPENAKGKELIEVMGNLDLLQLDCNDTTLIAEVSDLITYQQKIYLLDKKSKAVFVFDKKGHAINKIQNQGVGPNEYSAISCFYLDKKMDLLVLIDNHLKRKFVYDLSGQFIRVEEILFSIKSVDCLSDGSQVIVKDIVDASNPDGFLINILKEGEIVDKYLPVHYKSGSLVFEKNHPLTVFGDEFYYNSLTSDSIFQYSMGRFSLKYVVDFCGRGIPADIKKLPQDLFGEAFYNSLLENNYQVACWISVLDKIEQNLLLSYGYKQKIHYCLYNLESNECKQFIGPYLGDLCMSELSDILFYNNGQFCFVLDSFKISEIAPATLKTLEYKYPTIYKAIINLDTSDNPLLLFADIIK